MDQLKNDITVSICCITYNHEPYIAQAIEGFLMQKTNFNIEIIIGEDFSTDGTKQIIESYVSKYPNRINLITSNINIGGINNLLRVIEKVKGKYIALCDGDDYWTDPLKLQKQIDFLENSEDCIMCCHYVKKITYSGEINYMNFNPKPIRYSFIDVLLGNKSETSALSIVFKNTLEVSQMFKADWIFNCNALDNFIRLYATFVSGKNIYVFPEIMGCYRQHTGGIWSSLKPKTIKQKELNDLNWAFKIFRFSGIQKTKLLFFYLKKYFMFEVKEYSLQRAFNTVKAIF
jgi:glycosyltransferase involved in cell wall biosynthesis